MDKRKSQGTNCVKKKNSAETNPLEEENLQYSNSSNTGNSNSVLVQDSGNYIKYLAQIKSQDNLTYKENVVCKSKSKTKRRRKSRNIKDSDNNIDNIDNIDNITPKKKTKKTLSRVSRVSSISEEFNNNRIVTDAEVSDLGIVSTQSSFFASRPQSLSEEVTSFQISPPKKKKLPHIQSGFKIKICTKTYTDEEIEEMFNKKRNLMEEDEKLYSIRMPDYFTRQKFIHPKMRAILLDWVMEVCVHLKFRRYTYHTAVVLIDVLLSKVTDLETSVLQLIGVTCLIIAAKNEEIVIPSVEAFSHSTDYAYTVEEIIKSERFVLNSIKWKVNYPTLAFWSNYILHKWDKFASEFSEKHTYDLSPSFKKVKLPKFRSDTEDEYNLFHSYFQIIDCISLDVSYLQFSEKMIAASTIYLLLGLFFNCFSIEQVARELWKNPAQYSTFYELNTIFSKFLSNYLNCGLDVVIDHIVFYVGFFFNMRFDYSIPNFTKEHYEDFLQIQTHNPFNTASVESIIKLRENFMSISNASSN